MQRAVPREDRVSRGGGELAAVVGVAGLKDDGPALRAPRHVEPTADVEVLVGVLEAARYRIGQEDATLLVGDDFVPAPGAEQEVGSFEEALGAGVPLVFGQEASAPEVLAGEGI